MIRAAIVFLVVVAACGGKQPEPVAADKHEAEPHEANMPPQLAKFHDVLAPRWHAEKGPQRMKDTCAAIPDFTASMTALAEAPVPAGADTTKWTNGAGELAAAVSQLDETCKGNDATAFEGAFQKVHESFHAMLGASGPEHGEEHAM
jgi:hypothetical protein